MSNPTLQQRYAELPPSASRILIASNLPTVAPSDNDCTSTLDCIYRLFGQFGRLFDLRIGDLPQTRGYALVIFEDVLDAQRCLQQLGDNYQFQGKILKLAYFAETDT